MVLEMRSRSAAMKRWWEVLLCGLIRVLLRIEITPSVTYSNVINIRPGGKLFFKPGAG
jgi:hypothetical protein